MRRKIGEWDFPCIADRIDELQANPRSTRMAVGTAIVEKDIGRGLSAEDLLK